MATLSSIPTVVGQTLFGRYAIHAALGEGGMGRVYRGEDEWLGEPIAAKVLIETAPMLIRRFGREARCMARIHHPNVVRVRDFGLLPDGRPCIVMEFVDGTDVAQLMRRRQGLPWFHAVEIALGMARALRATHAAGVLHRDVKPANVLLEPGRRVGVKLTDFGVAHNTRELEDRGHRNLIVGTPAYMAPEQLLAGRLDARTDLYALGIVLFEMVAGVPPFTTGPATGRQLLEARMRRNPPRLDAPAGMPAVPETLRAVTDLLLAPDPAVRIPDCDVLIRALRASLHQVPRGTQPLCISDPDWARGSNSAANAPTLPAHDPTAPERASA